MLLKTNPKSNSDHYRWKNKQNCCKPCTFVDGAILIVLLPMVPTPLLLTNLIWGWIFLGWETSVLTAVTLEEATTLMECCWSDVAVVTGWLPPPKTMWWPSEPTVTSGWLERTLSSTSIWSSIVMPCKVRKMFVCKTYQLPSKVPTPFSNTSTLKTVSNKEHFDHLQRLIFYYVLSATN